MKIVFTGGGTAGHVMPNIALINKLSPTDRVFYFGSNAMEKNIIPQQTHNVQFIEINPPKLKRKLTFSNLLIPARLLKCVKQCKLRLKEISPDVVFCKGGFVSLPVAIAAKSLSIPVILHESDVTTGLANKLCIKNCATFLTTFESSHPKAQKVGCPIRQEIYSASAIKGLKIMGFDGKKPILLFLGGSQGAKQLNDLAQQVYPALKNKFDIFVVSGKGKSFEEKEGLRSVEFCNEIYHCLKASALCVTRGGSNTLCELAVINLPFIAIPLTTSSRGEQTANATYFAQRGSGTTLDGEVTATRLIKAITDCQLNIDKIKTQQKLMNLDGTEKILKILRKSK